MTREEFINFSNAVPEIATSLRGINKPAGDIVTQFATVKGSIMGVSDEIQKLGENRLLELAATELAAGNTSLANKYMAEYHALRKLNAEIQKNLSLLQYQLSPEERSQVSESSLRDELKDMR